MKDPGRSEASRPRSVRVERVEEERALKELKHVEVVVVDL
jgi:hypothetical protein